MRAGRLGEQPPVRGPVRIVRDSGDVPGRDPKLRASNVLLDDLLQPVGRSRCQVAAQPVDRREAFASGLLQVRRN